MGSTRNDDIYETEYKNARDGTWYDAFIDGIAKGLPNVTHEDEIRERARSRGHADRAKFGRLKED